MPIKLENVGIAVRDLEATIAFFTDLGLTVLGRDTVSGEWTDTAVGLDGNHANIAMLQTPDGNGRLELFEYIHPDAIETEPTRPNEIGMHRVAFSVDDIDEALEIAARHGCHPLRGVATYEDVYKLTYVRGPSGIIVMLAEELKKLTAGRWSRPDASRLRAVPARRLRTSARSLGSDVLVNLRPPRLVLVREPDLLRVERADQPLAFGARLVELGEEDRHVAADDD